MPFRLGGKNAALLIIGAFVLGFFIVALIRDGFGGFSSLLLSGASAERHSTSSLSPSALLALPRQSGSPASSQGMGLLMLGQRGFISRRILGCWRGTTAQHPVKWQVLSPAGLFEAYHRDNIELCLTWNDNKLKVTQSNWTCAGCSYSPDHRMSYRVVSATGEAVTIKSNDSAGGGVQRGKQLEHLTLNEDDTIDERIADTGYLLGLPAIHIITTAHLRRKTGSRAGPG